MTTRTTDLQPFRLQDLPPELRGQVYRQYFNGTELTLTIHGHEPGQLCFKGMPSLDLELVCQSMCGEARKARTQQVSRHLTFAEPLLDGSIDKLLQDKQYTWVRNHIRVLTLRNILTPSGGSIDWIMFAETWPQLQGGNICAAVEPVLLPLSITGDDFASAVLGRTTKDIVRQILRSIMTDEEVVEGTGEAFDMWKLQAVLGRRNTVYHGSIQSGGVYRDWKGTDLFSEGFGIFYCSMGMQISRRLRTMHPCVKSWLEEMEEAGELEVYKKKGGTAE